MDRFELIEDDFQAIHVAQNVARLLLRHPSITPQQIIILGRALEALQRLPDVTPGIWIEYGARYRQGDAKFEEMKYCLFRISADEFEISRGGSTYDSSVGSDSFSRPGWLIGVDGYYERDCSDLYNLEGSVAEYVNLGGKIIIEDESECEIHSNERN